MQLKFQKTYEDSKMISKKKDKHKIKFCSSFLRIIEKIILFFKSHFLFKMIGKEISLKRNGIKRLNIVLILSSATINNLTHNFYRIFVIFLKNKKDNIF